MDAAATTATTTVDLDRHVEPVLDRVGRIALVTQGVLYLLIGFLALELAAGHNAAKPSQRGALETVAHQPMGRVLLAVLLVGLLAHAGWRLALAARGEPGPDEDSQGVAKRVANVGRAAIYLGFAWVALKLLLLQPAGDGDTQRRSTARILAWPGGTWVLLAVGLAVAGAGLWNLSKIVKPRFMDHLDRSRMDEGRTRLVETLGRIGYGGRGMAYLLVSSFLVAAARQHDAGESRGLDDSMHALKQTSYGDWALVALAVALFVFGVYRIFDARYRKESETTYG